MKLKNKVALVTGASRGIGLAIARALAAEGARVGACSRNETELRQAVQGIAEWAWRCDVTQPSEIRDVIERAGRIDILVNNAGDAASASLVKTDLELWERMIRTNLTSVFLFTKAVLPGMIERRWGRVVNVISIAGKTGGRYMAAYSAAKHGVLGLTRCAALEAADTGVTVNAICPGYVDTPMTDRNIGTISAKTKMSADEVRKFLEKENARGRMIQPDEIARVAVFLSSEEGGCVTGEAIDIR